MTNNLITLINTAGSVIRMFQNAVGDDIFKEALNLYLTDKYELLNICLCFR